jgi:dTDP-4-amino-4,6-dideoxygalactose transaminase
VDKKMIYETKPLLPDLSLFCKKIEKIFKSGFLTNQGEQVREFEKKLERFLDVKNALVFCNGTLALQLAIQSLELKGEVITTPFTFPATYQSLVYNGLVPVFADIEPHTFNLNPDKIEPLINERTSAILPVNVFGNLCQVDKIQRIADKYHLKVIYDSAHAFGVKGAVAGDITMFSFHATKKFNTIEGGALAFNDSNLKRKLEMLRNFGFDGDKVVCLGTNAKMNEIQATFGLLLLGKVKEKIKRRKEIFKLYRKRLPKIMTGENYLYAVILLENRDEVYERLQKNGIDARKRFYPLCTQYLPVAKRISEQILSLPLYDDLTEEEILKISNIIKGDRE